jgi:hypothetical protein
MSQPKLKIMKTTDWIKNSFCHSVLLAAAILTLVLSTASSTFAGSGTWKQSPASSWQGGRSTRTAFSNHGAGSALAASIFRDRWLPRVSPNGTVFLGNGIFFTANGMDS